MSFTPVLAPSVRNTASGSQGTPSLSRMNLHTSWRIMGNPLLWLYAPK